MKFLAKANGKRGELYLYDAIGQDFFGEGLTCKSVQEALAAMTGVTGLDVYINSPGGSVFEGVSIYNQIARFPAPAKVHVDGLAASIASIVAMVGDEIVIAANAMMMIHDPYSIAFGTAAEMRKTADTMDAVRSTLVDTYVSRTGRTSTEISDWMTAETWMNAKECVDRGFAHSISNETATLQTEVAAQTQTILAKYRNTPQALLRPAGGARAALARMDMRINQFRGEPRSA